MIEEEKYEIILKIESINAVHFAAGVKLMVDPLITIEEEDKKEIIRAIATIIRIKKRKKAKREVDYWVEFLLTQFRFLNNRDKSKEISKNSLITDLYAEMKTQEKAVRSKK